MSHLTDGGRGPHAPEPVPDPSPDPALDAARRELKALREAEARTRARMQATAERLKVFAALVENSSDFIGIADPEGVPIYVNPAGRRMVGLALDHPIGETAIPEYYPPRIRGFVQEVIVASMVRDGHWKGETLFRNFRTEAEIPVSDEHFMITDPEDGRLLGMGTITRDITAQRRAQEATATANQRLQAANQVLRDNELRLRQAATVFHNTSEGIIIADREARITAVNSAYTKITGYAEAELIGQNPRVLRSGVHDAVWYREMWAAIESTGHWQGEIWNRRKDGRLFPAWENINTVHDDHGQITHYVAVMSDISVVKEAEERLSRLAHHDALTGLPNRLAFSANLGQALERARRHGRRLALLFLDLDRFKRINDTLGHDAGDRLLQAVAKRIQATVRAEDLAARLGGDEFTVVMEEIEKAEDASLLARKLTDAIQQPLTLDGRQVVPGTSIGISVYPDDADNPGDLARAADAAMYRAKSRGRGTHEFYTRELTAEAMRRLELEERLRRAMTEDALELYFQPQIDLATGAAAGVEALLRVRGPDGTLHSPTSYIEVAEDSGLIDELGTHVMGQACRQAHAWKMAGIGPFRLALNVSGHQIMFDHTVDTLAELLDRYELDAENVILEVEITESTLQVGDRVVGVLQRLREMGLSIAIDDFGTGYSSLSQLKHLPIDTLKIDRAFLRGVPHDTDNAAITAAIMSLGQAMSLRVVAEGVETAEQLALLQELGCAEAQGFWFSKPVPASQVPSLFARRWSLTPVA